MGLIDKAREIYSRRRKKGDLWNWAKKPERARRRVKRWKALADFANSQRALNRSLGRIVRAKAWMEARTIYRKKFRYLRDWLETTSWNKESPPPVLPPDVVANTRARYIEALERLTPTGL